MISEDKQALRNVGLVVLAGAAIMLLLIAAAIMIA
jgi:hypothetical protein